MEGRAPAWQIAGMDRTKKAQNKREKAHSNRRLEKHNGRRAFTRRNKNNNLGSATKPTPKKPAGGHCFPRTGVEEQAHLEEAKRQSIEPQTRQPSSSNRTESPSGAQTTGQSEAREEAKCAAQDSPMQESTSRSGVGPLPSGSQHGGEGAGASPSHGGVGPLLSGPWAPSSYFGPPPSYRDVSPETEMLRAVKAEAERKQVALRRELEAEGKRKEEALRRELNEAAELEKEALRRELEERLRPKREHSMEPGAVDRLERSPSTTSSATPSAAGGPVPSFEVFALVVIALVVPIAMVSMMRK